METKKGSCKLIKPRKSKTKNETQTLDEYFRVGASFGPFGNRKNHESVFFFNIPCCTAITS